MDGRTDLSPLERSRLSWTTGMLFSPQGINPGMLGQGESGGGGYRPGSAASAISSLAQLQTRYLPPSMHGSVGSGYNALSGHFGGLGSSPLGGDSSTTASGLDPYRTLIPTLHHYWTPPTPHTPGMEGQYGLNSGVFPTCLAPVADPSDHVFSPCTTPLAGLPQHALHRMYDLNTDYKYSGALSPPSASSALANAGAHQERLQRELAQCELQKQLSRTANKTDSRYEVIKSANHNKERSKSHERHERSVTKASGHVINNGGSEPDGGATGVTELESGRKPESAQPASNSPKDTLAIGHDGGNLNEKKRTKVILGPSAGHEHRSNERPTVRLAPRSATPKISPKESSKITARTTTTTNNNSDNTSKKKKVPTATLR